MFTCSDHFKEAVINQTGQRVELQQGAPPYNSNNHKAVFSLSVSSAGKGLSDAIATSLLGETNLTTIFRELDHFNNVMVETE